MEKHITSAAPSKSSPEKIDLEDISANLTIAITFNHAAENFLRNARALAKGYEHAEHLLIPEIDHVSTILSEMLDQLNDAKSTMDAFVDAVPARLLLAERKAA